MRFVKFGERIDTNTGKTVSVGIDVNTKEEMKNFAKWGGVIGAILGYLAAYGIIKYVNTSAELEAKNLYNKEELLKYINKGD